MKFSTLLGLALLASSHIASATTPAETAAADQQIRAALYQWMQAANKQDWTTALQLWAPDLVGWFAADNVDTYAQESDLIAHPPATRTAYTLLKVNEVIVEGSLAVVRDTWTRKIKQDDGQSLLFRVRRCEIWRLQPDKKWRISRYIESPPANTPGIPKR
jgi:ketosteroid isomerase-like protein